MTALMEGRDEITETAQEDFSAERTNDSSQGLEGAINSSRYKVLGVLGRGTWGVVYSVLDTLTGQKVAAKKIEPTKLALEQMTHRNLDEKTIALNESRQLAACSNVVPGYIELDDDGNPLCIMPEYQKFYSKVLNDSGNRRHLGNGITEDEARFYLTGIARGLAEVHTQLKRTHGDLKPDNIALDNADKHPLINDFGASTVASLTGASESPRDNIGFINTRAPECFHEDSHPDDVLYGLKPIVS